MVKKRPTTKEMQGSVASLLEATEGTVKGKILKEFYEQQTKCIKGIIEDDLKELANFTKGYSRFLRARRR